MCVKLTNDKAISDSYIAHFGSDEIQNDPCIFNRLKCDIKQSTAVHFNIYRQAHTFTKLA